jgi:uncharacterized membrane protein
MEELIIKAFRLLHIAAGFTALVVAPVAMVVRKGGDAHRRWGKVFFYAMAVVTVTAVFLGIMRPNVFLTLVAVFSFHMVATGYRSLYHKRLHQGQKPDKWDIILQAIAGAVNGGLFIWGIVNFMLGHKGSGTLIYIVFGLIGSLMVWRNIQRFYKQNHDKHEWLFAHMSGFLSGYIATVSAFSVVNMEFIKPVWLQWLWPTLVGSPLIFLWVRHYKEKFGKGKRARHVLEMRIR